MCQLIIIEYRYNSSALALLMLRIFDEQINLTTFNIHF